MNDIFMADFWVGEDEFGPIVVSGFFSTAHIIAARQRGNDEEKSVVYLHGATDPIVVNVDVRELIHAVTASGEDGEDDR